MSETGKVSVVSLRPVGSTLDGDHASGVTVLTVVDAVEFSETGGTLTIDGTPYAYTGWDEDEQTIALTTPTSAAYGDGQAVDVDPAATELVAAVIVDDQDEAIDPVTIPHELRPLLPEGPRADSDGETVEIEDGDDGWTIVRVLKESPSVDAGMLVGTLPDAVFDDTAFQSDLDAAQAAIVTAAANAQQALDDSATAILSASDADAAAAAAQADADQALLDAVSKSNAAQAAAIAAAATDATTKAAAAQSAATSAAASDATTKASAAQAAAGTYTDGQVATKGKIIAQVSAPTGANANANNLWINTTGGANTPNAWNGTAWAPITDKVASDAATAAFNAQTTATAASTAASTAQTTANGKNKIVFSTAVASGTGYADGDIWFRKSSGLIIGQWEFVSGAWAARTLDNAVIANLNAGKLTAGIIDATLVTLQTAGSGARVVVTAAGIIGYDGSGNVKTTINAATGKITATDVDVTGVIRATSGEISGILDMVGSGVIRTASSGQRVQISTAGLVGYDSAGTVKTMIDSATGKISAVDGTFTGLVNGANVVGGAITVASGATASTLDETFEATAAGSTPPTGWTKRTRVSYGAGGVSVEAAGGNPSHDARFSIVPTAGTSFAKEAIYPTAITAARDAYVAFDFKWNGTARTNPLYDGNMVLQLRTTTTILDGTENQAPLNIDFADGRPRLYEASGAAPVNTGASTSGYVIPSLGAMTANQWHRVEITLRGNAVTVKITKPDATTYPTYSATLAAASGGGLIAFGVMSGNGAGVVNSITQNGYIDNIHIDVLKTGFEVASDGTTRAENATITSLAVTGTATVPTPVNPTDASTKGYADAIKTYVDSKYKTGTGTMVFTAAAVSATVTITHNLGVIPTMATAVQLGSTTSPIPAPIVVSMTSTQATFQFGNALGASGTWTRTFMWQVFA